MTSIADILRCPNEITPNGIEVFRSFGEDRYGFKDSSSGYVDFNDYIIDKALNRDLPNLVSADVW